MEELITNPHEVRRLWSQARPADDKAHAMSERADRLARIKAAISNGTYDEPRGLDGAVGPLLAELNRRPAETVNPDDQVEHFERFE